MPSPVTAALHLLFLLVTTCFQTSQASGFGPLAQYAIGRELGEDSFHPELQRQKRNVLIFDPPPLEYAIDIEVSLTDSSLLEPIKEYFRNLRLPVSTNISDVEMTVSSINITTVCVPIGEDKSCCSCESGHAWPSTGCGDLISCPSTSLAPNQPCGYTRERPFHGPYCEPQNGDSCGMGEPTVMNMSVRLDTTFHDDLRNHSSELYKKYKADLDKAFNASYRCLPGFVSATTTGFRPGSVEVNYRVEAGSASFQQLAHSNRLVAQYVDEVYNIVPTSFTTEITNLTNFTVSPTHIFEGDTIRLMCEISTTSENATWYHGAQVIPGGPRHSLQTTVSAAMSQAVLTITNVTQEDSGTYICTFENRHLSMKLIYKGREEIQVSPLHIISYSSDNKVTCNSPEIQANSPVLFCCIDRQLPLLTGAWKVNGAISIPGVLSLSSNCTEYKLNVTDSLCLAEQSGTVTTYTCELQTGHGARSSRDIRVTYFRAAQVRISSSVNTSISEGYGFNLKCESDVSNYDSISWEIHSGDRVQAVECAACIRTNKSTATSVLTVNTATRDWNGTYVCTFSQDSLNSSASVTVNVISLPMKQHILLDPIAAPITCRRPQALSCCISANTGEDYDVKFVVQEKEFQAEKRKQGNFLCYSYNYTETECKGKELTAYCKFVNSIGQEVNSERIRLSLIPDKDISCSENNTFGREGDILIKPCSVLNTGFIQGNKIYKCWSKSWKLKRNDCLSEQINNLLLEAESLVNSPSAKAGLPDFLQNLRNQTVLLQNDSSANLAATVTILHAISSIPTEAKKSTITDYFTTVDIIVADSKKELWADLNKEETPTSSLLLNSVERFSKNLQPVNNTIPHLSTETLELQGMVVTEHSHAGYNKDFSRLGNLTANVLIGNTETLPPNSTIVSVAYSALGRILPANETTYVNSLVISTTLSCERKQNFHINMTFQKENLFLKMPRCVFWDFDLNNSRGGWDNRGCTLTEEEGNVICSCNHLTPFSILMSPDKPAHNSVEDYITHVGLGISILSLVVCIIIESLVWKTVTNNTTSYMRHICILNTATSLLLADIWFIVTASINEQNMQRRREICIAATFFIHLFYLCGFFWMLSLGLILFYRLVFILHNTSKTSQKAVVFCLGYGCPFIFAVTTIAVTLPRNTYIRKDVCSLNWEDSKAFLAFVIPALAIVAMNLFITAVVIIKILRPNIGDRTNKQERKTLFQICKSLIILTPLLGLTWGFGFATIIKNSHQAFHILFALLNALQGLFILVFGTLWDNKIIEALLKRNSLSRWSSQQTKSTSLILVTPMFSMNYPFSRTFNNLCGKTGKYTVSSSEPSTASTENTSKSYSLLN
ncbi:adhesion G protein-coupled receptor F5 [Numida meleagris]|uniref:adhesion G protein-coupled receptor F5 n=1 Tax=Numida meleagris TaxID=8996 RepID=UPI000B3D9232|nr:adhesion G protein-coupled receptor F5 [Numida meleagris]XP_021246953.1 adhesion G protein-coupled receptor F5 [Numida meleagris]